MRPIEEREQVINLYFHEGMGHKGIAKTTGLPLETVKCWCRRYRVANNIPARGKVPLSKEPISKETIRVIKPRDTNTHDPSQHHRTRRSENLCCFS
jgi:transposase